MGTSFGGIVAMTYASLYPEATTCCIAVASRAVGEEAAAEMQAFLERHSQQPWYPEARKTWDEWTDRVLAAADSREVDAMMAAVLPLYTADPDRPAVHAMIEEWRQDMKSDLAAIKAWESGLWQTIDARPLLAKIQCPTLVLVGALDMICGPAQGRLIADAVHGAKLVIVPDSGHFIAAEAPDASGKPSSSSPGQSLPDGRVARDRARPLAGPRASARHVLWTSTGTISCVPGGPQVLPSGAPRVWHRHFGGPSGDAHLVVDYGTDAERIAEVPLQGARRSSCAVAGLETAGSCAAYAHSPTVCPS